MCDPVTNARNPQAQLDYARAVRTSGDSKPEGKLSALMYRELQVSVSQRELRLFIKAHWSKISALAHQIHDED